MELRNGIGARLMRLRGNRSQGEVSKELCVEQRTLSHWENEERRIKDTDVIKLADYYKTTCDYILRGVSPDYIDIHKATGLSDTAIKRLTEYYAAPLCEHPSEIETLNYLLGTDTGADILRYICEYFGLPTGEKQEAAIYYDGDTLFADKPLSREARFFGAEVVPLVNLSEIAEDAIINGLRKSLEYAVYSEFEVDSQKADAKYRDEILEGLEAGRRKRKGRKHHAEES